ncbi:bacterial Ig-like domain-containing protein [Lactiplantibacillus songbeiensis]|uniref:Bacterial Ig-like domain-containing protein n=1 Tax=Lactiplantibacillus songbeiensis TaxID=2559920 RepID=A0ABW4C077_9LACO|nr:bacterial Ig-like domain-containing protein [Lactiplantibacillus songbeiensis]
MFNRLGNNPSFKPIAFGGLANWNVSNVTTFRFMFYNAQITSVDVKNWQVSQVTDMGYMFDGTSQLSSLDLSGWQVTGGTLSDMTDFAYESNISHLDLRTWQVAPGLKVNAAISTDNLTEVGLNDSFQNFNMGDLLGFRKSAGYPYDDQWIDEATQKRYTAEELETLYDSGQGTTSLYKIHTVTVQGLTTKAVTIYPNMTVDPIAFADTFVDTDDRTWNASNIDTNASNFKFASPVDTSQVGDYQVEIIYTNDQGQPISSEATLHVIPSKVTYTMQNQTAIINENPADAEDTEKRLASLISKLEQMMVADDNGQKLTLLTGLELTEDSYAAFEAIESLIPGVYSITFTHTDPIDNIPVESPVVTFTLIESKAKLTLNPVTIIRPDGSITATDLFQTALDGYGDSLIGADGQLSSAVTLDLSGLNLSKPVPGTYQISATYTDEANNVVTATQAVTVAKTKQSLDLNNHDQPVSLIAGPRPYFVPANLVDSATDGFGNPIDASQLQYDYYDLNNQPVTLDLKNPGKYQLKISYQDSAGNIISKTVPVNLDATKAKVKLTTNSEGIVINDTDFDPTSLIETAVDENDDPLSPTVVSTFARMARLGGNQLLITNHVDVTKAGTYTVDFSYTDVAGNVSEQHANVTVYVPATFAIQPTQTITQGEVFDPRSLFVSGTGVDGATLTAADLTYDLSGVDFTKAGVYQLPVSYKDQYGKLTTANSELTIKTQPVVGQAKITLNSVAPIVAAANQTFNPTRVVNMITTATGEKVAVTDPAVKLTSNVDPTKPGTYQVRVSYAGVSATATITVIAATNPGDDGNSETTTPTKPNDGHNGGTTPSTNPDDNGGTTTPTTPDMGNGNNATVSDNNGGTTMPTVNKPVTSVKTPATANQSKPVIAKKQVTNQPVTNIRPVKASLVATDVHVKTGTWQASPAGVMLAKPEKTTVTSKKVDLKAPTSKQPTKSQPISGELPQTNDRVSAVGIVGAALVGLLGLFGLASHRKF